MQRLPRIALSSSAMVARQVRAFRLLPSLHTAAIKQEGGKDSAPGRNVRSSYDMVIVGDGPVSPALACSIGCEPSLSHKQVLLLQPPLNGGAGTGSKVSILLQSSVDLLKRIGVWSELTSNSLVKPFKSVHIWDASSEAHVVFNHSDLSCDRQDGDDELTVSSLHDDQESDAPSDSMDDTIGYVVSNQTLTSCLLEHLSTYDNVQLETDVKAKVIRKVDGNMTDSLVGIMLDDGRNITSNLLVGSDGPNSRVRHLCGFDSVGWSHDQWAFTAAVEVKEAGRNSAIWQRLLPSGPITMLPLSDSTSALLWCTSRDHAQSLVSMSDSNAVVDAINAAFFDTLPQGDLIASVSEALRDTMGIFSSETPPPHQLPPLATTLQESSRAAASLALTHTPNYVKDRIALIGEASHQIHSLTGLGLNLGLGDAAALTEHLLDANSRGDDWGSLSYLLSYETERQRLNVPTMAAIEGFNWIYSSTLSPIVLLRSAGFNVANAFQPIREFILKQALWPTNSR